VRVVVGDAWGNVLGLQLSGFGAAVSIVLFGVIAVVLSVREGAAERRAKRERENEARVAA
jgi:hypothetical protein